MREPGQIEIKIGFQYVDSQTPTLPNASRGACSSALVTETSQQLADGLVWATCSFCGCYILVLANPELKSRKREVCPCGAKRIFRWPESHNNPTDGWRKDGTEWVMC